MKPHSRTTFSSAPPARRRIRRLVLDDGIVLVRAWGSPSWRSSWGLGQRRRRAGARWPAAEIQSYLVDDGTDVLVAATMGTLSAFFFILFLGAVRTFCGPAEGAPGSLSTVAFGAGLVTITLATTAALPTVALAWDDTAALADPGLCRRHGTSARSPSYHRRQRGGVLPLRSAHHPADPGHARMGRMDRVLAGVLSVIATFFLVADDPDSVLGTLPTSAVSCSQCCSSSCSASL